jgi:hypothetical protein
MKLEDGSWVIGKRGERVDHPDIADMYNTVLKMAKKRAYVDGILSATAASDCFTQDIDETHDIVDVTPEPTVKKEPVKQAPPVEAVQEAEVVKTKPQVQPQPAKQPDQAPASQPTGLTLQGTIEEKKIKPFIHNGKAGNKYGVKIDNKWLGTFDSKIYDQIVAWEKEPNPVLLDVEYVEEVSTKDGKTYLNLVSIKAVVANSDGDI